MKKYRLFIAAIITLSLANSVQAQTLRGSRSSVNRQHQEANRLGYSFLNTPGEVNRFVSLGYLVPVEPRGALEIHNVSFPFARPEVRLFLQRLSSQYRNACGENLTVTSLTRPISRQPVNASAASVHPTGMALDLRIPRTSTCRNWLERTLLSLEKTGVLDVTRERNPPHYHVALFTETYGNYVARIQGHASEYVVRSGDTLSVIAGRNRMSVNDLMAMNNLHSHIITPGQTLKLDTGAQSTPTIVATTAAAAPVRTATAPVTATHRVRQGDSLFIIAQRNNTTVNAIRALNGLQSDTIHPGQNLKIPGSDAAAVLSMLGELEHKVSRGESLWEIARRYGTSVGVIRSDNGLRNDFLQVGQILRVSI